MPFNKLIKSVLESVCLGKLTVVHLLKNFPHLCRYPESCESAGDIQFSHVHFNIILSMLISSKRSVSFRFTETFRIFGIRAAFPYHSPGLNHPENTGRSP